jgi:hypothetical protein
MRIRSLALLTLGLWLAVTPGSVWAQVGGYIRPPTVSPYVNLSRQQNLNPGITYYGLIRPEIEFRTSILGLQQRQTVLTQDLANQEQSLLLPPTGHPVGFLNQSAYFLNLGTQRTIGRPPTGFLGTSGLTGSAGSTARPPSTPRR